MISKLINSFAEMVEMKIYHLDIKPHNILCTQELDLKIIDFSISEVKDDTNDMSSLFTGDHPVQGTKGYLSPELQHYRDNNITISRYSREKSDVFSLGLVILQMVTLSELTTLNLRENNERLFAKIETVPFEWVKSLLRDMLNENPKKRKKFRKLVDLIPNDSKTETI